MSPETADWGAYTKPLRFWVATVHRFEFFPHILNWLQSDLLD